MPDFDAAAFLNRAADVEARLRRYAKGTQPLTPDEAVTLANYLMVPPEFGTRAPGPTPVTSYGLRMPNMALASHAAALPAAVLDMLSVVGLVEPHQLGLAVQRLMASGGALVRVEIRHISDLTADEHDAALRQWLGEPAAEPAPALSSQRLIEAAQGE